MATFTELLALPGALAAFEFRASGELLAHEIVSGAPVDATTLDLVAHICAANMSVADMQSRGWEKISGLGGLHPPREFTLIGFDWSVVASCAQRVAQRVAGEPTLAPYQAVVLANAKVDYDAAFAALER